MERDLVTQHASMDIRELKGFQDSHDLKVTQKGGKANSDNLFKDSPLTNALMQDDEVELHFLNGGKRKAEIKVVCVTLSWSDCHFGGQRPWFLCPGRENNPCWRRVGKLYVIGNSLLCRHCGELVYESQYHDTYGYASAKIDNARSIVRRLGGSGDLFAPFPPCPKGMHFKTYHRFTLSYCAKLCTARHLRAISQAPFWALIRRLGDPSDEDAPIFSW